ncbi:MAG: hypothetical protein Q4B92_07120 [Ruminococcus sp.]|nr:hypothetical protein [Ruminococcus sp.]
MTIFPTHKTALKTTLSKQEVLERLEHNNIYTIGFYYELKENGTAYTLNPVRKESGRNIFASVVNVKITEKSPHTIVNLRFSSLKSTTIGVLISSVLIFFAFAGLAISDIINTGFSISSLIYFFIGLLFYVFFMLMFSFEVLSIRKQIEEHVDAESNEISEEEMTKLQKWYEKEREPFKFRNR